MNNVHIEFAKGLGMALVSKRVDVSLAAIVGIASGLASAVTVAPVLHLMEATGLDHGMLGFVTAFAMSVGLSFAVLGGAFWALVRRMRAVAYGVFALMSILGMAAAVFVAVHAHPTMDNFLLPYLAGSLVGSLALAVPFALAGRFANRWRSVGFAVGGTTVWSFCVALALTAAGPQADALQWPWAHLLFVGWQSIFLMVFAFDDPETA